MNINEQIQNAEREIKWVREYAFNNYVFQQTKAMQSLLEVIKSLSSRIDDMQREIEKNKD